MSDNRRTCYCGPGDRCLGPSKLAAECVCKLHHYRALLDENANLKRDKERQWMPIETAPKDGTTFLASDRRYIWFGFWKAQTEVGYAREGWAICHSEGYLFVDALIEWMPLPDVSGARKSTGSEGEPKA